MDLLEAASGLLGHSPEGMGLEVTVESEASVEVWGPAVSLIHTGVLRQTEIARKAGVWTVCPVRVPVWKFNSHCEAVREQEVLGGGCGGGAHL